MVNTIECSGSYFEIGQTHGKQASAQIANCISNYGEYFASYGMDRPTLIEVASRVEKTLKTKVPHLYEEIQGIAAGSGTDVADIIMLNARSEIVLTAGAAKTSASEGMIEGCSTFSQKFGDDVWTAQNWDWQTFQRPNVVHLIITPPDGKPRCHVLTEAGLVGKIGINELGVSVNVNAIKATNLNLNNIPIHVLLRVILECPSLIEATAVIQKLGAASVGHILVGDPTGAISFETNPSGPWGEIHPDAESRIYHTNHLIADSLPDSINEVFFVKDTEPRLVRLKELVHENLKPSGTPNGDLSNGAAKARELPPPSFEGILKLLEDDEGAPFGILREGTKEEPSETIFSIVSNCSAKKSVVAVGTVTGKKEMIQVAF